MGGTHTVEDRTECAHTHTQYTQTHKSENCISATFTPFTPQSPRLRRDWTPVRPHKVSYKVSYLADIIIQKCVNNSACNGRDVITSTHVQKVRKLSWLHNTRDGFGFLQCFDAVGWASGRASGL